MRDGKMTHISTVEKNLEISCFEVLDVLFRELNEGLFCNWLLFSYEIFQFLVIKTLDPDWIRIRISIQPKMLDPDPYQMNADPQPCKKYCWIQLLSRTWAVAEAEQRDGESWWGCRHPSCCCPGCSAAACACPVKQIGCICSCIGPLAEKQGFQPYPSDPLSTQHLYSLGHFLTNGRSNAPRSYYYRLFICYQEVS
jgi:hypothetical protein